jgi:Tol biopolymer transport system component
MNTTQLIATAPFLFLCACSSTESGLVSATHGRPKSPSEPIEGLERVDHLILEGETHFAGLWKVTSGIENAAEGYWSFDGARLVMQVTDQAGACDRIWTTDGRGGLTPVSNGKGVTTCAYFLPGDQEVIYASTHAFHADCPPPPDKSQGYVWAIHPEYDIYAKDLASGAERALTTDWGYDAEATVSPRGDRMVYTSTKSGDLELWTSKLDGSDARQVTDEIGYDGGAFFSHDGQRLVFRSTSFTPEKRDAEIAEYKALLKRWLVRPSRMEIMVCDVDGANRRQVTNLGRANFAPYFYPDDKRIIFSTNHADPDRRGRNFDLYAIDVDGGNIERITRHEEFDGFPMFSPDGRWLVFASNRGATRSGETNLYIAKWK